MDLAIASQELPAQARLDSALQAGRLGYWELDRDRRLTSSAMHNRNFGRAASDTPTYEDLLGAIHPEDRERALQSLDAALTRGEPIDSEVRVIWPEGELHWLRIGGQRIAEPGQPERIIGISFDITDRKLMEGRLRDEIAERRRAEDHQRLLMDELNHRVRNTLAIVLAIANQTLRHANSAERFRSDFEARITALSQAHNLMTDSSWKGTSLRDIVDRVLTPYSDIQHPRHELAGDEVRVGSKYAVSLLMAFHELATNAAKYGALSNAGGRVSVSWALSQPPQPPALTIEWREIGGPPVKTRRRRGFGSRLIDGLAGETSGTVQHNFEREGVVCTITLPVPPAGSDIVAPAS